MRQHVQPKISMFNPKSARHAGAHVHPLAEYHAVPMNTECMCTHAYTPHEAFTQLSLSGDLADRSQAQNLACIYHLQQVAKVTKLVSNISTHSFVHEARHSKARQKQGIVAST